MKELTVSEWFDEIDKGLEYRRLYAREDGWNTLEQLFSNRHPSQVIAGPNLMIATGDSLLSALTVPYPYITVKARDSSSLANAVIQERLDNTLMDDLDICEEVVNATHYAFLWGKAFFKLGYDSEFGYAKKFDYGQVHNKEMGFSMTQFNTKNQRIEFRAQAGMPWIKAIQPHDIVVPWGTRDLKHAPWIAHRVVRHIDEVRDDVKYRGRSVQASLTIQDAVKSYESPMRPYRIGKEMYRIGGVRGNTEYVELWEIHDQRTAKIYVIATGHESFLRNEEDLLQIDGLPFVEMGFNPKSGKIWVTSDAEYLLNAQLELADIALQGQKHRRARVIKFLMEEGLMDEAEIENFLSADVGALAQFKRVTEGSIRDKVFPMQVQADTGVLMEAEHVRRNSREMVGLSANQAGEFDSSSRRSATEATIVSNASNMRMNRRQGQIALSYKAIFKKLNPICWEFWRTPQVVEILGPDGEMMYKQITGDQIKGEFRYDVGFSINPPEGLAQRRQNAMNMYMMLRQDPLVDPVQLRRHLSFAFNDPGFTSIFKQGVLSGQAPQGQDAAVGQPGQGVSGNSTGQI